MREITLDALTGASATDAALATARDSKTELAAPVETAVALSPEEEARVAEIADAIDFTRDNIESSFARDVQKASTGFADEILAKTAAKDTGKAGELLGELMATVDDDALAPVKKVPIIGTVAVSVAKLRRRYQKASDQIDDIVAELTKAQSQMVADLAMYDAMYRENARQYDELKLYVHAGRKALADFRAGQLPRLESEAAADADPMAAQVLKDFKDKLDRFEKRVDDLDRVSVVMLQTAPQIKVIQNADRMVADKIDTTISTTIPVWKAQLVIALGLENQRKALELQKRADDVTNRLLTQNAEALHTGAVAAAEANERSVVDVETLQKVNAELIATVRDTMKIQRDGRERRAAAESQMRAIESELKGALIAAARGEL